MVTQEEAAINDREFSFESNDDVVQVFVHDGAAGTLIIGVFVDDNRGFVGDFGIVGYGAGCWVVALDVVGNVTVMGIGFDDRIEIVIVEICCFVVPVDDEISCGAEKSDNGEGDDNSSN